MTSSAPDFDDRSGKLLVTRAKRIFGMPDTAGAVSSDRCETG